jgi:glycosyltransferase involved in cell wall biosynthesis
MSLAAVSVLLPVYNWPIADLVAALLRQAAAETALEIEILAYDDASPDSAQRAANQAAVAALPEVRYLELPANVGRAAIRNQLARAARHPWLLLLDADSGLPDEQFLRRYRQAVADQATTTAWIGGTTYTASPPTDSALRLRWAYGRAREQRAAAVRQQTPYDAFTLNNLLIRADVFARFGLDESLGRTYGHEDTAFGGALAAARVFIGHLDNPVLHLGLEAAPVFRRKTTEAVSNLVQLARAGRVGARSSGLWRLSQWLQRARLAHLTCGVLSGIEPLLVRNLDSRHPSLRVFDLWRLLLVLRCSAEIRTPTA